jgi:hypothetical protein
VFPAPQAHGSVAIHRLQKALDQLLSGEYNEPTIFRKRLETFVALNISEPAPLQPAAAPLEMGMMCDKSLSAVDQLDVLVLTGFVRLKNNVSISLLHAYSFCLFCCRCGRLALALG